MKGLKISEDDSIEILGELDALTDHLWVNLEQFKEEAPERDQIVLSLFGEEGVAAMVEAIVEALQSHLETNGQEASVLDVGCGTGTFTRRIRQKLLQKGIHCTFHGVDPSWHMLNQLIQEDPEIHGFIGVLEKLSESIQLWNQRVGDGVPTSFDAIISTLAFHHLEKPERAFKSLINCATRETKVIICDMAPYKDSEGNISPNPHGLEPEVLVEAGTKYFEDVRWHWIERATCKPPEPESSYQARMYVVELSRPRL